MGDDQNQIVGFFNDGDLRLPPDIFSSPSKFSNPQLYGPVVFKGSNASVSPGFSNSGRSIPSIGGGIWTTPTPLQFQTFSPVQPQFIRKERDWGMQRQPEKWFLRSRVVENRFVRVDGGNRGYGGTGVYLLDYTTVTTTTTISGGPKKRNSCVAGVRVTKQVNKAHKRCSPDKAHGREEDERNFELPPEVKALPQEWTY